MFASVFNSENPFWQGVARVADLIWLNILFLVACIPVITGGAAFTALYDTAWRLFDERGGSVTAMFWRSFRTNFAQATAIWGVVGTAGIGVAAGWLLLPTEEAFLLKGVLTLVYLLFFPFFFYLQARFTNTVGNTLKNAILIPLSRLPYAVGVLLITVVLVALLFATTFNLPQLLPPLVLVGFGGAAYAVAPLLNYAVQPWVGEKSGEATSA